MFSAKPVVLNGRYLNSSSGTLRLKGKMAGNDFVREIPVSFPENDARHDVLPALWARQRIGDLMERDYTGIQQQTPRPDLKETITQLGIEYRLMTQFTSFVAVEEVVVTDGGQPRRVEVPIEMPEGVNMPGNEVVNVTGQSLAITYASRQNSLLPLNGRASAGAITFS